MNLEELKEFKEKIDQSNIELPKDIVFILDDFEKRVPEEIQGHIEVEAFGVPCISKIKYEQFIKQNFNR